MAKPVQKLISERGFAEPTDPQREAIPAILEGNNVLLIAPTGTGKTEAAILPILSKFIESPERPPGIKILYVTPLRALNRDLLERLEWWCNGLDVKIAVRHGDTDVKERGRQAKNPPDLLITTPETLQAILPGRIMRRHLRSILYVIVDEVHEFSENKRGSQLSIALERLRSVTARDPQLVGLSATIGSPERVANFLVGIGRPFKVISVPVARHMILRIIYPEPTNEDYELANILYTHPEVAARLRVMRKLIEGHRSVLLFTNTRAIAEVLASRFKVWDIDFPVSIHHGSLAKPARIAAERGLKGGKLRGLVCVSGDSRVLLSNGQWTPIRTLASHKTPLEILSLSRSLRIRPASARSAEETGMGQLIQVTTRSGFRLKCTSDHRFLTIDEDGKLKWISARNLKPGLPLALARAFPYKEHSIKLFQFLPEDIYIRISDHLRNDIKTILRDRYRTYVNIARHLQVSRSKIRGYLSRGNAIPYSTFKLLLREAGFHLRDVYHEIEAVGCRNYVSGSLPWRINERVARFIGFLLSDGSISRRGIIRLHNSDLILLRRYIDILRSEFSLICRTRRDSEGVWHARTHATWLCKALRNMGIKGGKNASSVRIPPIFFSLPSKLVFAFLAGYFDGGGCIERRGQRIYSASFIAFSEGMARDLQLLLLNQGILSNLRKEESEGREGRTEYTVAVREGRHLRTLLKKCQFSHGRKLGVTSAGDGCSQRDCMPNIGENLKNVREGTNLTTYGVQEKCGMSPYKCEKNERAITRREVSKPPSVYSQFADIPNSVEAASDIFWDCVRNVEKTHRVEPVYDIFDVNPSSNFIVDGFITHNCTSSLELGLDIGRVDLCIQYVSPRQVTRLLQRVGRSGHRIGGVAKGVIVTLDSEDTLEAMVIARRAYLESLEPVSIPEKPFDALTHQITGMLLRRRRMPFQRILEIIRKAYPYRDLTEEDLVKVLTYMHTRYPRLAWVSFKDKLALSPRDRKGMYEYYYGNLSMIPYEKNYLVIDETNDTPIGILDEAFVSEYGEIGTKFIVRGNPWKIVNVYGDKIYVKPVEDPTGAIPSWVGEEIPVPFEVALEVGKIRRFVEERIKKGIGLEEVVSDLSKTYPADARTISRAINEIVEQVRLGFPIPTDRRITVEDWEDYVIIHACFGSMVNRTIARLIGHMLSEKTGYTIGVQQDPYRIVLRTLGVASSTDVIHVLRELIDMDIRDVAIKASAKTGLFKRRLIHVARRFGALSKWADLSSVSIGRLSKSFEGTVIYDEAIKETFDKDLDIRNSALIFKRIRDGEIEVTHLRTDGRISPIARVGLERIGRKSDLISPEKMRRILIDSARVRLLDGAGTFLCTNCWKYVETIRVRDLPDKPRCPKCGSDKIGMVKASEWDVSRICRKVNRSMTMKERRVVRRARETAKLISKYGRIAAVILAGKNLGPTEARGILEKERALNDHLFELVVEAERKALKKRFW